MRGVACPSTRVYATGLGTRSRRQHADRGSSEKSTFVEMSDEDAADGIR
jgi:hypothetical protein